ncbi:hypothetical protein ABK040_003479 [Willaertia magna]
MQDPSPTIITPAGSTSPPTTKTKEKKVKKNKPVNLLLSPKQNPNENEEEINKQAEETYTDAAVKIEKSTFKFGNLIEIGEDGIHRGETPKTPHSSSLSTTSSGGSNPDFTQVSSTSTGIEQHIQYEDLEEICKLGRGASATVSKVMHKKTKQIYAMKRINVELEDQKPKLIVAEFKALYNSDCPYIINLYDAYYRQGCILMILEFMDCGSLEDLLKVCKRVPEPILSRMCYQILTGLHYLHTEKKIVHRDIKPANILVNSTGRVCLADFGMAGFSKSQNQLQAIQQTAKWETFCGTFTYMSPERIRGQPHSFDSDIWAFGLTMAECYLGYFPFTFTTSSIWDMINHLEKSTEKPFVLEGASEELQDFIFSTLKFQRKQRPSAADLLNHAFIKKYQHKKDSFLEKWIYLSYIKTKQTLRKKDSARIIPCDE